MALWKTPGLFSSSYYLAGAYTWTKPSWAKTVEVLVAGAGGGGGSGRRGASGTERTGGSGGAGGGVSIGTFDANDLPVSLEILVGTGGGGGAGATTDNTNGENGIAGGSSRFGPATVPFVSALGGLPGAGGSTSQSFAPQGAVGVFQGGGGGASPGGSGNSANSGAMTTGGSGGGGVTAANGEGLGGPILPPNCRATEGQTFGAPVGANGWPGTGDLTNSLSGRGGGGGGGSNTAAGGNGAVGGLGCGGGGGGACVNGFKSGDGGSGGGGLVVVTCYG